MTYIPEDELEAALDRARRIERDMRKGEEPRRCIACGKFIPKDKRSPTCDEHWWTFDDPAQE